MFEGKDLWIVITNCFKTVTLYSKRKFTKYEEFFWIENIHSKDFYDEKYNSLIFEVFSYLIKINNDESFYKMTVYLTSGWNLLMN